MRVNNDILKKLESCFYKGFISLRGEFIANPKTNSYFRLPVNGTIKDFKKKIIYWLSRDCGKGLVFDGYEDDLEYLQNGFNKFLGTNFTTKDFLKIYEKLGNGINEHLTELFIDADYDITLLED